jgi:hypothetical protein
MDIRDVLNRRSDLSTFVVHLTRDLYGVPPASRLRSILTDRKLIAATPMGFATSKLRVAATSQPASSHSETAAAALTAQSVVSFSETPLEHIYTLAGDIDGRRCSFSRYGVAFTKVTARLLGVNPIWYVDATIGVDWPLVKAVGTLVEVALGKEDPEDPIFRLTPFIDMMGSGANREFSWEREWRHRDNLDFAHSQLAFALCPEEQIPDFEKDFPSIRFLDPAWGLERMIAHLVGLEPGSVTMF